MPPTITSSLVAIDVLCCMGIGFFLAALRFQCLVQARIWQFLADFFVSLLGLVLVQSYVAQASNAGVFRFYMILSLAAGAFAYYKVVAPYQVFILRAVQCVFLFPLRIFCRAVLGTAYFAVKKWILTQKQEIKRKRTEKRVKKQLQKQRVLLYNSSVSSYPFFE